ncbi:MAG: secretin N-terminal domain-containing protein, partial [Ectothiorhodospiraceae bacterium]
MMTLTRRTAGSARGVVRRSSMLLAAATGLLLSAEALAENTLRDISYSTLPGNRVQVSLDLEEAPEDPNSFTIDDPARITFDFPGTRNGLSERTVDVGVGLVEGVTTAEAGGRTRVVLNLADMTEYETEIEDNTFNIFVGGRDEGGSNESGSGSDTQRVGGSDAPDEAPSGSALQDIDFERGEDGTGRILVDLNEANIPVDMGRSGGEVRVVFRDAEVPEELRRRLDVVDFATPVKSIETRQDGDDTVMQIEPVEDAEYEHLGYQAGSRFTVEFQPLSEEEQEAREEQEYTGERLSLSFQDIEVRSVLQLIGDFTGLNMVVSDDVTGNITLRLQDVPWDQALDIILTTQGLDKRRNGNVILVAPAEVIAQREQQQREAEQQQEELAPLRTEFFEINYANADELAELIRAEETSLLSERGQVATDSRTNTLIVQETDSNLSDVRSMINRLDVPVRQVLIESRIVIAQDDFNKDLGVRFGASANQTIGSNDGLLFGGTQPGQQNFEQDEGSGEFNDGDSQTTGFGDEGTEGLLVDLPADGASASAGLAIG